MLEMIMKLNIPLYVMTSMGCIGGLGMLATNLTYRRMIRNTQRLQNLKEKWLNLWKSRDRLWHRMNRFVWYPSLFCTFLLGLSVFLNSRLGYREGLPMLYLYIGAAVPVVLLLLRQALDFSYKEELVMASLADYVEQVRTWVEEVPVAEKPDPVLQEEIVDHQKYPSDGCYRKPLQQDAFSGGGRDHAGDHTGIYECRVRTEPVISEKILTCA